MKTKTQDLSGAALDWAVAKIETRNKAGVGLIIVLSDGRWLDHDRHLYSTHWAKGGPIIEREEIYVRPTGDAAKWECYVWGKHPDGVEQFVHQMHGPTPLIAAMRCYVASKLGDEVEMPEELAT